MPFVDDRRITGPDVPAVWFAASNELLVKSASFWRPSRFGKIELQFLGSVLVGAATVAFVTVVFTRSLQDGAVAFVAVCAYASLALTAVYMGRRSVRKTTPGAFQAEVLLGNALPVDSYAYHELDKRLKGLGFDDGLREADKLFPNVCAAVVEPYVYYCRELLTVLADPTAAAEAVEEAEEGIAAYADGAAALVVSAAEFIDPSDDEATDENQL
jgi:hypothetical protein